MLEGERNYNEANLDMHLMSIQNVEPAKRKRPKPRALPSINWTATKRKMSKDMERFYKQYAEATEQ